MIWLLRCLFLIFLEGHIDYRIPAKIDETIWTPISVHDTSVDPGEKNENNKRIAEAGMLIRKRMAERLIVGASMAKPRRKGKLPGWPAFLASRWTYISGKVVCTQHNFATSLSRQRASPYTQTPPNMSNCGTRIKKNTPESTKCV